MWYIVFAFMKMQVFCGIAPSRLVDSYRHLISSVKKPKKLLNPEDEKLVTTYQLTSPNITQNFHLQEQRPENLKSCRCNFVSGKWTTRF